VHEWIVSGKALAVYTPTYGGVAEAVLKMCLGNGLGFAFVDGVSLEDIFGYAYGSFVVELAHGVSGHGNVLGVTTSQPTITRGGENLSLAQLQRVYEDKLESVYPCNIPAEGKDIPVFSYETKSRPTAIVGAAKPKVLIPVFPGTNCEYDTARAMADAGAEPEVILITNRTGQHIAASTERFAQALKTAQMVFIPGGFSGGDEPDGSGKFITAFFRNAAIKAGVEDMLDARGGLMAGVCNGFQALIKLGLVPYGKIIDTDDTCPTLTFNTIGRHQSRLVRTRIASNKSPWLAGTQVGDIYTVPISHGEGRFLASEELVKTLAENGQIATQYVDLAGKPTDDVRFNPNNSVCAIEGITSPDGRVFGKMGHSERIGANLYKNVDGIYDMKMFESAVRFFHKN
jgi:phosphoribosylformylglycinamidine synthase